MSSLTFAPAAKSMNYYVRLNDISAAYDVQNTDKPEKNSEEK